MGQGVTTATAREFDLPPLWDGVPIEWGEWKRHDSTLVLHLPVDQIACDKCGALDESDVAFGRRGNLVNLVAHRCRHCAHDTVEDRLTDEWWDLDPDDYGMVGSQAPEPDTLF